MNIITKLMLIIGLSTSTIAQASNSETLLGYVVNNSGITIQVASGGCTGKQSFEVQVLESYPVQLDFNRIDVDMCEAYFPYGTQIQYTFEELNLKSGTEFTIRNKLKTVYRAN